MIRHSHVSLVILCGAGKSEDITAHLGVRPSSLRRDDTKARREPGPFGDRAAHSWVLDSPRGVEADATVRLAALADIIEPFGEKLLTLDSRFKRRIDVVYHITPRQPHGVTGEFDWLSLPADLMKRLGRWNLDVCYESLWFDHPDWVRPRSRGILKKVLSPFRKR